VCAVVCLPLFPLDRQKPSNLLPQVRTGGLQDFSPEAGSLSPQFENAESATSQMFIALRKSVLAAVRLDAVRLCFSGLYREEFLISLDQQKKTRLKPC